MPKSTSSCDTAQFTKHTYDKQFQNIIFKVKGDSLAHSDYDKHKYKIRIKLKKECYSCIYCTKANYNMELKSYLHVYTATWAKIN